MATDLPGIDIARVSRWMKDHVSAALPLDISLIAGGRSNLTFRVVDAEGNEFALRRPPVSNVLSTAHDMEREVTIISALRPQGVPVARLLGTCLDESVIDAPFYVMEFVRGIILRDKSQVEESFDRDTRGSISSRFAAQLASLHEIDVDEAGLGGLARHDGYIGRQLRRWRSQYDKASADGVLTIDAIASVGDQLATSIPVQQRTSVVHGDYRLDNVILDEQGAIRAILDWEICTLGDPLADLGQTMVYWTEPGDSDSAVPGPPTPTIADGFFSREELRDAYSRHSSLDLTQLAYYQAFGLWKVACIMHGVYARYSAGATAGDQSSVSAFPDRIEQLVFTARQTLEQDRLSPYQFS